MKFDTNGNLIPKITKEQAHTKIQNNVIQYNSEISARNMVHKIAEALAVVVIEKGADAILPLQEKGQISEKLQKEIDRKIPLIRAGIKAGIIKINHQKMARSIQQISEYLNRTWNKKV